LTARRTIFGILSPAPEHEFQSKDRCTLLLQKEVQHKQAKWNTNKGAGIEIAFVKEQVFADEE
jgi:hypothetical protein